MLNLKFNSKSGDESKVLLCLGAHSDDIEIGCGGSILRLIEEYPNLSIWWVVFCAQGQRADEAQASAEKFLAGAGHTNVLVNSFRDGFLPYDGGAVKEYFEQLKKDVDPDIIFTHYRHDLHQDHRLVNELTWNTWRDHLILEYEIPKYDGDLGKPNFFIPLERRICERKNEILRDVFLSQTSKPWFASQTFWALLQLRGIESRATESLAEAFYSRKIVI